MTKQTAVLVKDDDDWVLISDNDETEPALQDLDNAVGGPQALSVVDVNRCGVQRSDKGLRGRPESCWEVPDPLKINILLNWPEVSKGWVRCANPRFPFHHPAHPHIISPSHYQDS